MTGLGEFVSGIAAGLALSGLVWLALRASTRQRPADETARRLTRVLSGPAERSRLSSR
jgi:hypothetical protein